MGITLLMEGSGANDRAIDGDTSDVEVSSIVGLKHGVRNVRYVDASIALSSDICLASIDLESVHKVPVEAQDLLCQFNLICDVRRPLREANSYWLLNVNDVRQVVPAVGVSDGSERAGLPCKGTVLIDHTADGAAAWAAIEPANRH